MCVESKLVVKKDTKYEEHEGLDDKSSETKKEGADKEKELLSKKEVKKQETIRMRITTEVLTGKESEEYKAAIIGDEVGDPMKATSGPSISILMKQTCLIALIFGEFFASVAIFNLNGK